MKHHIKVLHFTSVLPQKHLQSRKKD